MRLPRPLALPVAALAALALTFGAAPGAFAEGLPSSGTTLSTGGSGSLGSTGSGPGTAGSSGIPTLGALFPSANPYSEETENNLVAFGDSFTANSHWLINRFPQLGFAYPTQEGCFVAPDAWPALVGEETGRPVQNWACNGHTTSGMLGRIDRAIAAGHINDTSTVVLAAGMNDKRIGTADDTIRENLVAGVEKVRAVAPDAEILLLGRLSTTSPDGIYCDRNIVPNLPFGESDARTAAFERANQENHKAAAAAADVPFIDIRDMTVENNSTCARDADRYVSGHWDLTTPGFNMRAHPSFGGSRFLAEQIIAAFGTAGASLLLEVIDDVDLDTDPVLGEVADELGELLDESPQSGR
ncbi:GDSL-type esterase/lipase family protein [Corynebacterium sp. USCH3]|uniref:SGNH/GDSL hydrolase family protein n=1 Tax=Corynebacterium sp. USCH3 TaxID=3024840 RepID=UPI0030A9D0F1